MRDSRFLTRQSGGIVVTENFSVAIVQISNPTGSAIYMRQGGTDIPDATSYDYFIPAQTFIQLPAVGTTFAFVFATPSLIGIVTPQLVSTITLLDSTEKTGNLGSIQPVARPILADRNGAQIVLEYNASNVAPHPLTNRQTYVVPNGRRAQITQAFCRVYRDTVATTASQQFAAIFYTPLGGTISTLLEASNISNTQWAGDKMAIGNGLFMYPGDIVNIETADLSVTGTGTYVISVGITEGDA